MSRVVGKATVRLVETGTVYDVAAAGDEGGLMQSTVDPEQLKGLIKEALIEIIDERREMLRDLFEEVLEEIALSRAIEEGRRSEVVTREEVFALMGNAP